MLLLEYIYVIHQPSEQTYTHPMSLSLIYIFISLIQLNILFRIFIPFPTAALQPQNLIAALSN